MDDHLKVLSKRLRYCRGELSQESFAEKIGISRSLVKAYENGTRMPRVPELIKIAKLGGVTTDYLLGLSSFALSNPHLDEQLTVSFISDYTGLDEDLILAFHKNKQITQYLCWFKSQSLHEERRGRYSRNKKNKEENA